MVIVLFSIPQIKTVYTVEAKTIEYGECVLTSNCVAPWLEFDDNTPEGYLKNQLIKNGLENEIGLVTKLIQKESGWNEYAIGVNKNGTKDLGIFQINDIHKLSNEFRFDYKKAIDWSIAKRLNDGGWYAWSALKLIK